MPIRETFFVKPFGLRRGDIVRVLRTSTLTDPIPNTVTHPGRGFFVIKIREIPDPQNRVRFRRRFAGGHASGVVINPDADGVGTIDKLNNREWFVILDEMPDPWKNALNRDGEISRTWAEMRPYLRKKKVKIADTQVYDPAQSDPAEDTDASSA